MTGTVQNSGSGSFGEVETWDSSETVTPQIVSDTSTTIGDTTITVGRRPDTATAVGNDLILTDDRLAGAHHAKVNTVRQVGPRVASLVADSAFGRFLTGRMSIPGIESGLPAAALDVAMQASGTHRQSSMNATDNYWSLEGHSVGFTPDGDVVAPTTVDRTLTVDNPVSVGRINETVLYQEVTGLVIARDFTATGLPRHVTTDTVQLREFTYLKVTLPASAANGVTTIDVPFGPSFRRIGIDRFANGTLIRVTLDQRATNGLLTTLVRTQNAAGANVDVSNTTVPQTALARTQSVSLAIEVAMIGGALRVRAHAATASTAVTQSSMSAVIPAATRGFYSKHIVIARTVTDAGIRDLVTRRAPADKWATFTGIGYATSTGLVNELTSNHDGSPIAAHDGEMWDYVKQIASARNIEVAPVSGAIVMREHGTRAISLDKRASASVTISDAVLARKVSLVNQNTRALSTTASEVFRAETIYSVDIGETKTFDVRVPDGIRHVWSPLPWFNESVTNGIVIPAADYVNEATALRAQTVGRYYITARDGFPVNPLQWTDYGGRVTASIADGRVTLTLVGPKTVIPGIEGPFRIGESDTSVEHAVLRIHGVGVSTNPVTITLPSGADPARTRVETAANVTNVALGSLGEVLDAAAWVAQRTSGPTVTLTAVLPLPLLVQFGVGAGSLVRMDSVQFRVDSLRISNGTATLTGSKLTRLGDTPLPSRTLDEYAADMVGATAHDHSIRPLAAKP